MTRTRSPLLAVALMLTCGNSQGSGFPDLSEPANTTALAGSVSSGHDSTSTSSTTVTSGDALSEGMKFDMPQPDGGRTPPLGCQGKIDFLFAISANAAMKDKQEQLIASFPGFIAAIKDQLPEFDVHILSANAHGLWAIPDCSLCSDSCDPQGTPPYCGVSIVPCDKRIGAGVTFPVGVGASNRRCDLHGERRYIAGDEPQLAEMFDCIARVGLSGEGLVAEAMVEALDPEINGSSVLGCNEGFLRDDALLVVVLINDSFDEFSDGTPQKWINVLRAAKHGDDDAFAVLVLTTDADDESCAGICVPACTPNKNPLRQLVEGVEHGFIGSICAPNLSPFFVDTVSHIVGLCDRFVIPT